MSEQSIWSALRAGGLSEAGTAAVMGNFYCESLLIPNNVEDRCTMSDADYTYNVDNGIISRDKWSHDGYGYGLYQLTYWSRKQGYYDYVKGKGLSISDEASQCEYCLKELKSEYPSLYEYLCSTTDIYTATSRFCKEFERPALNNVESRCIAAKKYYDRHSGSAVPEGSTEVNSETTDSCDITVRTVHMGDRGTDVAMLQTGLNRKGYPCGKADGIFGTMTKNAVTLLQKDSNIGQTGVVYADTWQILFQ